METAIMGGWSRHDAASSPLDRLRKKATFDVAARRLSDQLRESFDFHEDSELAWLESPNGRLGCTPGELVTLEQYQTVLDALLDDHPKHGVDDFMN